MLVSILVYLCCGAVAGVLAGLLGVGGGIVIVPMMVAVFPSQGIPAEYVQQIALGTSLASIMITSISSSRAHHKRGAVHWDIFRNITPGILLGTFLGRSGVLVSVHAFASDPSRGLFILVLQDSSGNVGGIIVTPVRFRRALYGNACFATIVPIKLLSPSITSFASSELRAPFSIETMFSPDCIFFTSMEEIR